MKRSKGYKQAIANYDRQQQYSIEEAIKLVKENTLCKFDASIEVNFHLNVDPRHADQMIRGAMVLPNGTGKSQKVLAITQGAKEQEAKDAGADYVGGKDLLEEIKNGWFDFDIIVATPDMMGELGKLGRILGPKGLMPNPKTGTVNIEIGKAVEEIKKGKVEYRTDREGNINCLIGKKSFTDEALAENFQALYDVILRARPAAVKGQYIKNLAISSTMSPSVKVLHD